MADAQLMDKLTSLAKRRGFIFQSSEIYGGTGSVWDYGPLGIELKRNVKDHWWSTMVHQRDDVEGLDTSILMNPKVWEASGHVDGFTDPLVECSNCHRRFRADLPEVENGQCPTCGTRDVFGEPRLFNLMFKTFMGPVEEDASVTYLRPETAQGSYVNFLNVQTSSRQRVPFGIAQIGKAFRNEITPGNFIFRTREFEQMELQFFVEPGQDDEWFDYWMDARMDWHLSLGIRKEKLRFHEHGPDELAHYAKKAFDIEYKYPFGWKEFEGIHNRTDFDLSAHQEHSGKRLEYIDPAEGKRFIPYVVETAVGVDRTVLVALVDAYREEEVEGDTRVGQYDPFRRGVADVALAPKRHVLQRGHRVAANEAGDTTDALGKLRIALVRHGGGPGLTLAEGFFDLSYFRALQTPYLSCELLQRGGDLGEGYDKLGVAVALDDLV